MAVSEDVVNSNLCFSVFQTKRRHLRSRGGTGHPSAMLRFLKPALFIYPCIIATPWLVPSL